MQCNESGLCVSDCPKQCAGKECGDDGCGGSCGDCPEGYGCDSGICVAGCKPDCLGKECGPDGCGGNCGACGFDFVCVADGICVEEAEADEYEPLAPDDGTDDKWIGGDGEESDDPEAPEGQTGDDYDGPCPPGEKLWYGKCIPEDSLDFGADDVDADSGCAFASNLEHSGAPLFFLLLAMMVSAALVLRSSRGRRFTSKRR